MIRPNLFSRLFALRALVVITLVLGGSGLGLAMSSPASADTAPTDGLPETVSADSLPTWQVNGVVWSQVVVGNTVYVTGDFTKARPPGVAEGGAGEIAANDIFAYDITTGNRVASFSHQLNGQGLVVRASPDGSRVYVGGDFTTVDGVARNHLAAFNTATGALDNSFKPSIGTTVGAIAVSPTTVYIGGNFSKAAGQPRIRLASFAASNGALQPWAPTADDRKVQAMVLSPDGTRVIIGGRFTTINGAAAGGMGSVDSVTGATEPWAINQVIKDSGTDDCGITNLSVDNNQVYGGGFAFGCGNFEGTFAADPNTGAVNWINDCHGDTYDTFPIGQALYTVSHVHNCSFIGAFPNSSPTWSINMRHAMAFTTYPTGGTNIGPDDYGWNYNGIPDGSILQWFPEPAIGSFTGQGQAAWTVSGNSNYVVLGGEFPRVNGKDQYGLARFATKNIAPNKRGPVLVDNAPAPSALSFQGGQVRVAWQSAWDMDNKTLTYTVTRSDSNTPIYTTTGDSTYWKYPMMGFIDKNLTPGSQYTYTVKATDAFGNSKTLGTTDVVTVAAGGNQSQYSQDVSNDGASDFWRLGEASGSAVYDYIGFLDQTAQTGVTRGAAGAINGDTNTASTFNGNSDGFAVTNSTQPATPNFTLETWIKTTTNRGGKIVGYGDANTGNSGSYDRHIYMDNSGHVIFGVYNNTTSTITSPNRYNDGQWHQIVASLDSAKGMTLYIDGKRIGVNQNAKVAQAYTGYWRIGGDNLNGWPSQPSSSYFSGSIDDFSLYPSALSLTQVRQHYIDSGRTLTVPQAPADNYGKAVFNSGPDLYWRLADSIFSSTAADSGPDGGQTGTYSGGVSKNQSGVVSGNAAVAFNGSSGTIGSTNSQPGPVVYSEELWFKTSTTHGGKLIGFGDARSGNSSNYDRHVYMENSGQLTFGVWTGVANTATSPSSYNDNKWHYMVATQGPDGMHLYVDGVQVASNPQASQQVYNGYWRVGGDTSWGGDSSYLNGTLDEVAVYSYELTPATVKAHYQAGGGVVANQPPTAAYTDGESGLKLSVDGSGSSDPDGTVASYDWNWGDGSPHGTGVSPNHTYGATGDYTVTLTVTDNQNATGTSSRTIHVTNANPDAAFTTSVDKRDLSVDASGSSDSDGSVASYDWNWGDGTPHGSGVSPNHTYASNGTYTVTLTVTDNAGGTDSVSHDVTASLNEQPNASFTDSEAGLKLSVNGGASNDPDGTIASYDWDWGDGSAHSSGVSPNHTYGATGDYTVTLTVTDNQGATGTSSRSIHVDNANPDAAFSTSINNLDVTADASGSSDSDGSIASYDWNWGDGTPHGSGVSPGHSYGSNGTYTITLTVTDNAGGTDSVSHDVTVSAPVGPLTLAADDFGRTSASGWGTADQGGPWTVSGNKANFTVGGGVGVINLSKATAGPSVTLNNVSSTNTDVRFTFSQDKIGNGGGTNVSVLGRQVPGVGNYRAVVAVKSTGQVTLSLVRVDGAGQATITPAVTIPGLVAAAGDKLDVRMITTGTSPTTLEAKVWRDGQTEPASWQVTGSDGSGAMQAAGSPGVMAYLSGSSTNAPVNVSFDGFRTFDSTTTVGQGGQAQLAKLALKVEKHPSREPSEKTRVAPDFKARLES